jgi:hypothetical protein
MRWLGSPTRRVERSGRVKRTMGSGSEVKKGDNVDKLESCSRTPVQSVSAMRGEAKARENAEDFGSGSFVGGDRVTGRGDMVGFGGRGRANGLGKSVG